MSYPKRVAMVRPDNFRVEYAINPHMLQADGSLNTVNTDKALTQWTRLKNTYEQLGLAVHVLDSVEDFPDMVFCANQTLPYLDQTGQVSILLSTMHSEQRKGEVPYFEQWAKSLGFNTHKLVTPGSFEGAGDALWNYSTGTLFGGYGFRTTQSVYSEVKQIIQRPIVMLQLIDEQFYHLDTCLTILNANTAGFVKDAFDQKSIEHLKTHFTNLIEISREEAIANFAGNAHGVDGQHVILQRGAQKFCQQLREAGLTPIEVDTSEFIKSGGSVFCLKQIF